MVEASLRGPKFFRAKIRGRKFCIERRVGKMPTSEIKFSRRLVSRIYVQSLTIDVLFSKRKQNKTHFKAGTFDLFKETYGFVKEGGRG